MTGAVPYDAAADAAKAAWAGVQVTGMAAVASTLVAVAAVVAAFYPPIVARRQKIKSGLYLLGHAVVVTIGVSSRIKQAEPDAGIFLQEILNKLQASAVSTTQFFALGIDDEETMKVASDFQTNLLTFIGFLEYNIRSGVQQRSGSAFKNDIRFFDLSLATTITALGKLMARYGVTPEEALKAQA